MTSRVEPAVTGEKGQTGTTAGQQLPLERLLGITGAVLLVAVALLLAMVLWLANASGLVVATAYTLVLLPMVLLLAWVYRRCISPFYRMAALVEAIRLEDYSLRARKAGTSGIAGTLERELSTLSDELQQRKQSYDHQVFLIYQLIAQLETPMAVFNQALQLQHANEAFSDFQKQPWQSLRQSASHRLGLLLDDAGQWQFSEDARLAHWQIRQSRFTYRGESFHLVILTDIEQALRKHQLHSWQQIIRVLSHEIKNSLTPIKSLAQSLAELPELDDRARQALSVIVDRSVDLQAFVGRYGAINKPLVLDCQWFDSAGLVATATELFGKQAITVDNRIGQLWGDPLLLQQVLINLVKNAVEASEGEPSEISLTLYRQGPQAIIAVRDSGMGLANPDNLFIPFYTTKSDGQGIGLGLCRNIVEHHSGRLTLENNSDGPGALARIWLPLPEAEMP